MEKVPNPITSTRGRLLHYLGRGGDSGSSSRSMMAADKAAAEQARWDRRNAAQRAAFVNLDIHALRATMTEVPPAKAAMHTRSLSDTS